MLLGIITERALRIADIVACLDHVRTPEHGVDRLNHSQEEGTKWKCSSQLLPKILAAKVQPHAGPSSKKLPWYQLAFHWTLLLIVPFLDFFKVLLLVQILKIFLWNHNTEHWWAIFIPEQSPNPADQFLLFSRRRTKLNLYWKRAFFLCAPTCLVKLLYVRCVHPRMLFTFITVWNNLLLMCSFFPSCLPVAFSPPVSAPKHGTRS